MISRFLLLYAVIYVYFGVSLYLHFGSVLPSVLRNKIVFAIIVTFISQLYVVVNVVYQRASGLPPALLNYFTALVFALFAIMIITLICLDMIFTVSWILRRVFALYDLMRANKRIVGIIYLVVVIAVYVTGIYSAYVPRETRYEVEVSKPLPVDNIRIVQITDFHITNYSRKDRIEGLIERVNELQPDLVFIVGDLLDNDQKPYVDKEMAAVFKELKPRIGVYSVLGNHEYYGEGINGAIDLFNESGLGLLRDNSVYIPELGLTVVGRDDLASGRFGIENMSANDLLSKVDRTKPVIMLDHQPQRFDEAREAGADLQLSGHTHNGQIFPINIVEKFIYELPWGIMDKDGSKLIVSCGVGTWGLSIRTGSYAEIVVIDLKGE